MPAGPEKKRLIFLRSCDLHALKRLDQIYLGNGPEDFYYRRLRDSALFVLMGCPDTCDTGFCVSMGTDRAENYDLYLKPEGDTFLLECRSEELRDFFPETAGEACGAEPDSPAENREKVRLPKKLSTDSFSNPIWEEYESRCIGCGRCNFVCPTCTCFTMQDIAYRGKRRGGRSAEGSGPPARWTASRISQAEAASGKSRENGCALRRCTRFMILKNGSVIPCAWAAAAATQSVRNIFPTRIW